jgi:hypothetical protein
MYVIVADAQAVHNSRNLMNKNSTRGLQSLRLSRLTLLGVGVTAAALCVAIAAYSLVRATPNEGNADFRWGNVVLDAPDPDGKVVVVGWEAPPQIKPPEGGLAISIRRTDSNASIIVDAENGSLLMDNSDDMLRAVAETVQVVAPIEETHPEALPWPYSNSLEDEPRISVGRITFLQPDPASGITWSQILSSGPLGSSSVLEFSNGEAKRWYDTNTGEREFLPDSRHEATGSVQAAFDRLGSTIVRK